MEVIICEADRHGFKYGTISRVLFGKQKYAYDCIWLFEDDYLSGNYEIPPIENDRYDVKVDCFDINNNYIKSYNNIYEIADELSCYKYEIYNVLIEKRKSFKNYKFKFSA